MEFSELKTKALEIQAKYRELNEKRGQKYWTAETYLQGLVTDIGELNELLMAKNGYRNGEDIDQRIQHELADCMWALIVISSELGVDLEKTFSKNIGELNQKIDLKLKEVN